MSRQMYSQPNQRYQPPYDNRYRSQPNQSRGNSKPFSRQKPKWNGNCFYCAMENHYWRECYSREINDPEWSPDSTSNVGNIVKILETEESQKRQPQIEVVFSNPILKIK